MLECIPPFKLEWHQNAMYPNVIWINLSDADPSNLDGNCEGSIHPWHNFTEVNGITPEISFAQDVYYSELETLTFRIYGLYNLPGGFIGTIYASWEALCLFCSERIYFKSYPKCCRWGRGRDDTSAVALSEMKMQRFWQKLLWSQNCSGRYLIIVLLTVIITN